MPAFAYQRRSGAFAVYYHVTRLRFLRETSRPDSNCRFCDLFFSQSWRVDGSSLIRDSSLLFEMSNHIIIIFCINLFYIK